MPTIKPTIGRVLHYRPDPVNHPGVIYAAIVAAVHSESCVTLSVFDQYGHQFAAQSVVLRQEGDPEPAFPHAVWMPYQVGQAVKTEAAEAALAASLFPESERPYRAVEAADASHDFDFLTGARAQPYRTVELADATQAALPASFVPLGDDSEGGAL